MDKRNESTMVENERQTVGSTSARKACWTIQRVILIIPLAQQNVIQLQGITMKVTMNIPEYFQYRPGLPLNAPLHKVKHNASLGPPTRGRIQLGAGDGLQHIPTKTSGITWTLTPKTFVSRSTPPPDPLYDFQSHLAPNRDSFLGDLLFASGLGQKVAIQWTEDFHAIRAGLGS